MPYKEIYSLFVKCRFPVDNLMATFLQFFYRFLKRSSHGWGWPISHEFDTLDGLTHVLT